LNGHLRERMTRNALPASAALVIALATYHPGHHCYSWGNRPAGRRS
jgi:hypothetical protein